MKTLSKIIVAIRIRSLKRTARQHYLQYQAIRDSYSCGHAMAMQVSPDLANHVSGFNAAMEKLAELDPTTPKNRL